MLARWVSTVLMLMESAPEMDAAHDQIEHLALAMGEAVQLSRRAAPTHARRREKRYGELRREVAIATRHGLQRLENGGRGLRLQRVPRRAARKSSSDVVMDGVGAQHQDLGRIATGELARGRDPVDARQRHVHDDNVRARSFVHAANVLAVRALCHHRKLLRGCEQCPKCFSENDVVVDQRNGDGHGEVPHTPRQLTVYRPKVD